MKHVIWQQCLIGTGNGGPGLESSSFPGWVEVPQRRLGFNGSIGSDDVAAPHRDWMGLALRYFFQFNQLSRWHPDMLARSTKFKGG